MVKEEIEKVNENLDEIIQQINQILSINKFEQYVVINKDHFIAHDLLNMDFDITVEEETVGIKLLYDFTKSNINEEVTFAIGIPNEEDVITLDELFDIIFDFDFDEDFDFEELE